AARAIEPTLTDDAYVQSTSATGNFGAKKDLRVQPPLSGKPRWRSYVKFDVAGALPALTTSADVELATLRLFVSKVTAAGSVEAHRVTSGPWKEGSISDSSAPMAAALPEDIAPVVLFPSTLGDTKGDFVALDVTQLVKDWIDNINSMGGIANNGI